MLIFIPHSNLTARRLPTKQRLSAAKVDAAGDGGEEPEEVDRKGGDGEAERILGTPLADDDDDGAAACHWNLADWCGCSCVRR